MCTAVMQHAHEHEFASGTDGTLNPGLAQLVQLRAVLRKHDPVKAAQPSEAA